MSTSKKVLIGVAALFALGVVFSAGEEAAKQDTDPGVSVNTTPYRTTTPVETSQDILDNFPTSFLNEFCDVYADGRAAGATESEMFSAFASGYGTAGPPYASEVWTALKSYCSY